MNNTTGCIRALLAAIAIVSAAPAFAQVGSASTTAATQSNAPPQPELWLTTPFPDFSIAAGETAEYRLVLKNQAMPPQRVTFSLTGLPDGWTSTIKGGGHAISSTIVNEDDSQSVDLDITPPASVTSGSYRFEVDATAGSQTLKLPLSVALTAQAPASIKLEPDLPALKGTPTTTFDYHVKIDNNSPQDHLFNLNADTPPGFTASFKHGYDTTEITGVPIKADSSDTVTLEVKPNPTVAAGAYPINFQVQADNLSAQTQLGLLVNGSPELGLSGPGGRLSGEATAGQSTTVPFTVTNSGSAPATNVKLSANAPTGWTVAFDPDSLPGVDPNGSQDVNVRITPSDQAIAGDYVVTLRASGDGVSQSADFRVTVNTSTIWGIVGIIVIAVAVIVIVLAVLRYGRR